MALVLLVLSRDWTRGLVSFFSSLTFSSIFWLTMFSFSSAAVLTGLGLLLCLANMEEILPLPALPATADFLAAVSDLTGEGFLAETLEKAASMPEDFLTGSFFSSVFLTAAGSVLTSFLVTWGPIRDPY